MMEVEQIFSEIRQMQDQYRAEVTGKRKTWPKSIRERVIKLSVLGIRTQVIVKETGISLNTIYSWVSRGSRKAEKSLSPSFVPVTIKSQDPNPQAFCTETHASPTVTVVVNSRIRIEGYPADQVLVLLTGLMVKTP